VKQTVGAGAWTKRPLRSLLEETDSFVTIAELATSRGLITDATSSRILGLARSLAEHPRFDTLSITDNPGGYAMLSADTIGTDLMLRGQEIIIHLSCKDWNRNALESRCWMLASEGFRNVLALSGDYPVSGYHARKMDELLKYMASRGLDVPVVADVFVLTGTAARYFHSGKIPGVTATGELMALVEKHAASPDKGRAFFLEFAAKQCAIARGSAIAAFISADTCGWKTTRRSLPCSTASLRAIGASSRAKFASPSPASSITSRKIAGPG
jgi:hypothetical protein